MMVAKPETQVDGIAKANATDADGRSLTQFTFHIETKGIPSGANACSSYGAWLAPVANHHSAAWAAQM